MKRIKYISRMAEGLSPDDVNQLVARAEANNREQGITGILMSAGGLFFQVIEGPDAAIDRVYAAIAQDARHTDLLLVGYEPDVDRRLFPDWSLGKIDLDDAADTRLAPLRDMLEVIVAQHDLTEKLTGALERGIWNELTDRD